MSIRINGTMYTLGLHPFTTLLEALRESLHFTGTKLGCGAGSCGACTVLLDGRRIKACLTLAAMCQGHSIVTIEGVSIGDELHPLQAAFVKHDAFQCGFCTPGQIMSAIGYLGEGHSIPVSLDAIREHMSGNLCRCGAYPNIVAAISEVARAAK